MRYSDKELQEADDFLGMSPDEQMERYGKQQVHKEKDMRPKLVRKTSEFNIWAEGYRATGEHGRAVYMGRGEGATFPEACDEYFNRQDNKHDRNLYSKRFNDRFYWSCKLFNNEADARKAHG